MGRFGLGTLVISSAVRYRDHETLWSSCIVDGIYFKQKQLATSPNNKNKNREKCPLVTDFDGNVKTVFVILGKLRLPRNSWQECLIINKVCSLFLHKQCMLLARDVARLLRCLCKYRRQWLSDSTISCLIPSKAADRKSQRVSTTTENTITYHNALCLSPQNFTILRS